MRREEAAADHVDALAQLGDLVVVLVGVVAARLQSFHLALVHAWGGERRVRSTPRVTGGREGDRQTDRQRHQLETMTSSLNGSSRRRFLRNKQINKHRIQMTGRSREVQGPSVANALRSDCFILSHTFINEWKNETGCTRSASQGASSRYINS